MLIKRLVLCGCGIAILLGGTAVVLDSLTHDQAATPVQAEGSSATPTPGPGGSANPPSDDQSDVPIDGQNAEADQSNGTTRPEENGKARELEVLPPVSASPTGLPAPSPPAALVSEPLPAAASAQGTLVEGFPSNIVSFPDGTAIVFTGISPSDGTLQATAEGIVELSREKVIGHFQQILQSHGFRSEEAPAVTGQQALRLARGNDSVSVTFSTTGTGSTRFSLLGNFHTEPGW
ncbi:hypothetical protein [Arthrobacter nitrophenolicus]|uniref:Uncharacterized protein n=1 Tax=Arthrobacter nitrophenolicus TaxID=683150 RepID=A0A4R5YCA7_9MICC|nr:hypothetical protein [Arthrobacter nitrophenolicus]TDL41736.1 hypothetical protein E2R57_03590 [Arthrobacter nitrophenolicus]